MKGIKENRKEIFAECNEAFGVFHHAFDERSALEVLEEEREAFFEKKLKGLVSVFTWVISTIL